MGDDRPGRHRATPAADEPDSDDTDSPEPDQLDADEGEPDIEAFAGDEKTVSPNPAKDGEHGYGYE